MGNNLDLRSTLGLNVTGLADLSKLEQAMKGYDVNLEKVRKSSVKLNAEGKVSRVTLDQQVDAYTRLVSTLKLVGDSYVKVTETTERNTAAADRQAAAVERAAQRQINASKRVVSQILSDIEKQRRAQDALDSRINAKQVRTGQSSQAQSLALQALQQQFGSKFVGQNLGATQSILGSASKNFGAFQQALAAFQGGNAEVLTGQAGKIQAALTRLGDAGTLSGNNLTRAWSTFVGVFTSQILFRSVSTLINTFNSSIREAAEFEKQIAATLTISQKTSLGFDNTRQSLRRLSDQFGTPLGDNAIATYEAISNQVAKGADAFLFIDKASKFAQASISSTANSVDLLSSVLNSYSLTVDKTDRISAILFKTIDLGRVRANDLAQTYGRLLPTAKAVGVSFEEVSAAVATLTVQGVKPADSLTLINNLLLSLLKPTDEMKKLFQALGVSSGEAAVRTFGFAGILKILDEQSKQGSTRLAQLGGNIRSIRAELGLSGESFKTYQKNLQLITDGQDEFNKAVKITGENAGKSFDILSQRIKNVFVVDFGKPFLDGLLQIDNAIGGLDKRLIQVGRSVKVVVNGFGLFNSQAVQDIFEQNLQETGRLAEEEFTRSTTRITQLRSTLIQAQQDAFAANLSKVTQQQLQVIAAGRAQASAIISGEQRFQNQQNLSVSGDLFFRQFEERVRKYQDLANQAKSAADQARRQLRESPTNLATKFEGLREALPLDSRIDQARELLRLRTLISNAPNQATKLTTADNADKFFDAMEKAATRLVKVRTELARSQGAIITPKQEERRLEQQLTDLNVVREQTLRRIAALQDRNTASARQQVITEQNRLKAIQDAFKQLSDFKLETPTGDRKFKTAAEASAEFERRRQELFKLLDAGPQKNLNDIIQQFGLFVTLEQRKASIVKQIKAQQAEEEASNQERTIAASSKAALAARDQIAQGQKVSIAETTAQVARITNQIAQLRQLTTNPVLQRRLGGVTSGVDEFIRSGDKSKLDEAQKLFDRLKNQFGTNAASRVGNIDDAFNKARQTFEVFKTQSQLAVQTNNAMSNLANGLNTSSQALQGLGVTTNNVFSSAANSIDLTINRLANLERQARQTAAAIGSISTSTGGGGGDFHNGGLVGYYANGGVFRPRGTDTRPAMLTPGEIVMPVGPSRKYRSQLLAMVAGRTPSYFAKGGSVTNVGDINMTIENGPSEEQTIRRIVSGVRRQIRLGALNNF